MAETIPGGAYLAADKKTWHDANGNSIPAPATAKTDVVAAPVESPEPVVAPAEPVKAEAKKPAPKAEAAKAEAKKAEEPKS